jgi:hypothetical protein
MPSLNGVPPNPMDGVGSARGKPFPMLHRKSVTNYPVDIAGRWGGIYSAA